MAPAIAHFLVGASLVLVVALPFCLPYGVNREHGLWLIPIGGIWGITPDLHNIAPVLTTKLYAFHNSRWVDLFGLHYTLDRPIVRQQYVASVFGSILVFSLAVALFWTGFRAHEAVRTSHRDLDPAVFRLCQQLLGPPTQRLEWPLRSVSKEASSQFRSLSTARVSSSVASCSSHSGLDWV